MSELGSVLKSPFSLLLLTYSIRSRIRAIGNSARLKGKERGYGFRALARSVESPFEAFLLTRFRQAPKLVARRLGAALATTATIQESFSTGMQQRCGIRASARSVESPVEAFLLTRFRPAAKLVPTQSLLLHALDGGAH